MFATAFPVNCQTNTLFARSFLPLGLLSAFNPSEFLDSTPLHTVTITKKYYNSTADQYHFYNCIIKRLIVRNIVR